MTADRFIGIFGLCIGVLGLILTVLVAVYAPDLARLHKRHAESKNHDLHITSGNRGLVYQDNTQIDASTEIHIERVGDNVTVFSQSPDEIVSDSAHASRWTGNALNQMADSMDTALENADGSFLLVLGLIALAVVSAVDMLFLHYQKTITTVIAGTSIIIAFICGVSLAAALLKHNVGLQRRGALLLFYALVLTTACTQLPRFFQEPIAVGGRFRGLLADIPITMSLWSDVQRLHAIYGWGVFLHVMLECFGTAILSVLLLLSALPIIRVCTDLVGPRIARRLKVRPFGWVRLLRRLLFVGLGVALASGAAEGGYARLENLVPAQAPPPKALPITSDTDLAGVSLVQSGRHQWQLRLQYCKLERLLKVELIDTNGQARPLFDSPDGGRPSQVVLPSSAQTSNGVRLRLTSTRYYPRTIWFHPLPARGYASTVEKTYKQSDGAGSLFCI